MKFDGDFWYFWFVARLDVALQDFLIEWECFGIQGCFVGDDYEVCKRKKYGVVIESIEFDIRIYLFDIILDLILENFVDI